MLVKVSDYIADFLVENGIDNLFTVVGGGAMHLNDSFGHKCGLHVTYHHHEQAAAIAAEAFARMSGRVAAVCTTSGPGASNALTGCLCAYTGSMPMIIFSGQVRYPLTARGLGLNLRWNGEQEYDICRSAAGMTKYCEMPSDPKKIRYYLEKALFIARSGRPGPVWLDIPLDVQGAMVERDELAGFNPSEEGFEAKPTFDKSVIPGIVERIRNAQRPAMIIGQGVRQSGKLNEFLELVEKLGIPVTTGMSALDYITDDHPYYAGRAGATGNRAGNFTIQNCDLLLAIGSRLSYRQTGYSVDTWARGAYKIMVEIDPEELKREYLHIDMPICADAGDFICEMLKSVDEPLPPHSEWMKTCKDWIERYPVVTPEHYTTPDGLASIYVFLKVISDLMPEKGVYVLTAGYSRHAGRQALRIKKGQRVVVNHTTSPMGYCLPATIGTSIANDRKPVVVITGEGGFQMNIQELQTIKQNRLPVHIVVVNNGGYHSIRVTQNNFFKGHSHVGMGEESGDLSFPELKRIAWAYDYPYFAAHSNDELEKVLKEFLACDSYCICEIFVTPTQVLAPKAASRKTDDGKFVSAPLEDMAPFLSREELAGNMFLKNE